MTSAVRCHVVLLDLLIKVVSYFPNLAGLELTSKFTSRVFRSAKSKYIPTYNCLDNPG